MNFGHFSDGESTLRDVGSMDTATLGDLAVGTETEVPRPAITREGHKGSAPAPASSQSNLRYSFGELLGSGGMGEVLAASDEHMGRTVALKRAHRGEHGLRERFIREAKIQARLEHPSIVPVYDMAFDPLGQPFFTMKKLAGRTLADIIAQPDPGISRHQLLQRFAELCLAVEYAHQRGVIHRDIKPANIMLGDYGEIYLLDWGIAKVIGDEASPGHITGGGDANLDQTITGNGDVIGTIGYMAPEQSWPEDEIDHRVDVFSLGMVLFELLAGVPLIPREMRLALLKDPANGYSLDVKNRAQNCGSELEPELIKLVSDATAASRDLRISSARKLHDRLTRYLDGAQEARQRQELAEIHARSAEVLSQDSQADELRQQAVAEAARALAIDPTNKNAQKTLGSLLANAPKTIPLEVQDEVEKQRLARAQRGIKFGVIAYAVTFLLLPLVWFTEMQSFASLVPLELALAFAVGAAARFAYSSKPTERMYWAAIAGNAVYLALLSRIMGPIAITPAIAMMSICLFVQHGITTRWWAIIAAHVAALVGPFALTELGLLAPSLELQVESGAVIARSNLFSLSGQGTLYAMIGAVVCLVATAGLISRRYRREQQNERAEASLERWHLKLLVPGKARKTDNTGFKSPSAQV